MSEHDFRLLPLDPVKLDVEVSRDASALDIANAFARAHAPRPILGIRIRIDGGLITIRDPAGHIMWSAFDAPQVGMVLACHECRNAYRLIGGAFSLEARVDERPQFVVEAQFSEEPMRRMSLPRGWMPSDWIQR